LGVRKHACIYAEALYILYEGSTHAMEVRMSPHMLEHACTPNRHACTCISVCLLIGLTFYPNRVSCVVASMHKEQRKARAWGLFVDHPGYCSARRSRIVHCARCAAPPAPLLHVFQFPRANLPCARAGLELAPWSGPAAVPVSCPGVLLCERLLCDRARCDLCHVCPP